MVALQTQGNREHLSHLGGVEGDRCPPDHATGACLSGQGKALSEESLGGFRRARLYTGKTQKGLRIFSHWGIPGFDWKLAVILEHAVRADPPR